MATTRPLDVVFFGATGLTGKYAALYVFSQYFKQFTGTDSGQNSGRTDLRIGLAGRSLKKLGQLKEEIASNIKSKQNDNDVNDVISTIELIEADVSDLASLVRMCSKARVVISFVGPYSVFGEQVIKACLEASTNYIDITGEYPWVKQMYAKYNEAIQDRRLKFIPFCGVGSLPFDLAASLVQKESMTLFDSSCDTIKTRITQSVGRVSGGTMASYVNIMIEDKENSESPLYLIPSEGKDMTSGGREKSQKSCWDKLMCSKSLKCGLSFEPDFGFLHPSLLGSLNTKVINWSNSFRSQTGGLTNNFEYNEAFALGFPWWKSILLGFFYLLSMPVMQITKFFLQLSLIAFLFRSFIQNRLSSSFVGSKVGELKFSTIGTTKEDEKGCKHSVVCAVKITGDPGYEEAAKMAVECAMSIIMDPKATPDQYGILPPSIALDPKSVTARLNKTGSIQISLGNCFK